MKFFSNIPLFRQYQRLDQAEEDCEKEASFPPQAWAERHRLFIVLMTTTISFVLGIAITAIILEPWNKPGSSYDLVWSSSLASRLGTRWIKFEGKLFGENAYRGTPSDSIDEAWERYTQSPWFDGGAAALSVTEGDIKRARKVDGVDWLNSSVVLDDENGGGYMGTLEVFHQLHCLDMIRRYTYPDYYPADGFLTRKKYMRDHVDHCIDMIRQVLMCYADTGLITFHWAEGMPVPVPDFNTWHQCRDSEDILQWAKAHEAPINHQILKPDGVIEMPSIL